MKKTLLFKQLALAAALALPLAETDKNRAKNRK